MSHQTSFADLDYSHKKRRTRREVFLSEMEGVIPWQVLLSQIEPHYPKAGRRGRRRWLWGTRFVSPVQAVAGSLRDKSVQYDGWLYA